VLSARGRFARSVAIAALLLAGWAARGAAGADAGPDVASVADDAAAADAAGDAARLRELAARDAPDPWRVADRLCRRGAFDAAAHFAAAARLRPDVAALAKFVDSRRASPPSAEVESLLERAAKSDETDDLIPLLAARREGAVPFDRVRLSEAAAQRLRAKGRIAESAAAELDAADDAARIGWLAAEAECLDRASRDQLRAAEYAAARSTKLRQLERERTRGLTSRAAVCCAYLGIVAVRLADYRAAVAWNEEAVAALETAAPRDDVSVAHIHGNLALVHHLQGDYSRALSDVDAGLAALPPSGTSPQRVKLLIAKSEAELSLGERERALASCREAMAIAESAQDTAMLTNARASTARVLVVLGDLDGARSTLESALAAAHLPGKNESLSMRIVANLVNVAALSGDVDAAMRHGERALALATKLKDENSAANVMQDMAIACRGAGKLDAAESWVAKSLEIAERLESPKLRSDAWKSIAANAVARGDLPRAVDAARRAIAEVVRMTSGLAEGQGAQARENYAKLFRMAVGAAAGAGDAASLFEFAESGRAVEFLASLEQGDAIRDAAVAKALRDAEETTRVAQTTASLRLDAARAAGDLALAKTRRAEFEAARTSHEEAVERIRREARSAVSIYPVPAKPGDLRAALADSDAFVVYALGDASAAALVVTKDAMRLVPLGAAKDVAAAWNPSADDAKTDAALAAMTKSLVEPLKLPASVRRVLVSPDGDVFRAPLAALFPGREIVHAPSASVWLLLSKDEALRGTKVLALGSPDYEGTKFTPLAESGAEAKAIGDVVVTGKDATEAGLRAALAREPRWRAIHLAAHGVTDTKRPMRSALALTAAEPDDGLLTAMEVVTTPMPADLVVLSACSSGGGRVFAGEGLVGLPRAFLFAGSPRVIASSWKVDDAATRALMTKFYELWRGKGLRASAALAGAQDFLRADERWRHPRHWAAWTLWGTGD
jgi:CHAT domain-containing protein